jgi:hypothetical protein
MVLKEGDRVQLVGYSYLGISSGLLVIRPETPIDLVPSLPGPTAPDGLYKGQSDTLRHASLEVEHRP